MISYDKLWRTAWGDLQRCGPVHRHTVKQLTQVVSSLDVQTILDVGCGAGDCLARLADFNRYALTGLDVSQEALSLAGARAPSARFVRLDIEHEMLPTRFDLIMSVQVIEHLQDDQEAIRNMARMSRKYVLISTIGGPIYPSDRAIGHLRSYSQADLQRKMARAGLCVLKIWGWGFPFYSPCYRLLSEWLPAGPPRGPLGRSARIAAKLGYYLYQLNLPGVGDVLYALAERQ